LRETTEGDARPDINTSIKRIADVQNEPAMARIRKEVRKRNAAIR